MSNSYVALGTSIVGNPNIQDVALVRADGFITIMDQGCNGRGDGGGETTTIKMDKLKDDYPQIYDMVLPTFKQLTAPKPARTEEPTNKDTAPKDGHETMLDEWNKTGDGSDY